MVARLVPAQEARVRFLLTVPFTGVPLEGCETPNLAKSGSIPTTPATFKRLKEAHWSLGLMALNGTLAEWLSG